MAHLKNYQSICIPHQDRWDLRLWYTMLMFRVECEDHLTREHSHSGEVSLYRCVFIFTSLDSAPWLHTKNNIVSSLVKSSLFKLETSRTTILPQIVSVLWLGYPGTPDLFKNMSLVSQNAENGKLFKTVSWQNIFFETRATEWVLSLIENVSMKNDFQKSNFFTKEHFSKVGTNATNSFLTTFCEPTSILCSVCLMWAIDVLDVHQVTTSTRTI